MIGKLVAFLVTAWVAIYLSDHWGIGWWRGYLLETVGYIELTLWFAICDSLLGRKQNEQN